MKNKHCYNYVWLNGTALRYREQYNDYWCDNGCWGVNFIEHPDTIDGYRVFYSKSNVSVVDGKRLLPCNESDWLKSVGNYLPNGYKLGLSQECEAWKILDGYKENLKQNTNKYLLIG
jgi:hypothetical protein